MTSRAAIAILAGVCSPAIAQKMPWETLDDLRFQHNRPAPQTVATLLDALAFQQATQTCRWIVWRHLTLP